MSFCRITGRARGLPKPNFFPIIPPISPADAAKLCRITGKRADNHNFVPLLEPGRRPASLRCPVTGKNLGKDPVTGRERWAPKASKAHGENGAEVNGENDHADGGDSGVHAPRGDYKYLRPNLRKEAMDKGDLRAFEDLQRVLKRVKKDMGANADADGYVYLMPSMLCGLVLPPEVEEAIRRGELEAVSVSKGCDRALFKVRGKRTLFVPLEEASDVGGSGGSKEDKPLHLLDGLGQSAETLKRQKEAAEAARKKRGIGNPACKKVFEALEKKAGEEMEREREQKANLGKGAKVTSMRAKTKKAQAYRDSLEAFKAKFLAAENMESFGSLTDALRTDLANVDWEEASAQAAKVARLAKPSKKKIKRRAAADDNRLASLRRPKNVYVPDHPGLEMVPLVEGEALKPSACTVSRELIDLVARSRREGFDRNSSLKSMFADEESLRVLPTLEEFVDIGKHLAAAGIDTAKEDGRIKFMRVGCLYDRGDGVKFADDPSEVAAGANIIVGAIIETEGSQGPKFVPGERVGEGAAARFVPGQRMTSVNGEFIPGASLRAEIESGGSKFQFIPGVVTDAAVDGDGTSSENCGRFVAGQFMTSNGDTKPSFLKGQVVHTKAGCKFVEGETVVTADGLKMIAG
jgi:hypothetical protein